MYLHVTKEAQDTIICNPLFITAAEHHYNIFPCSLMTNAGIYKAVLTVSCLILLEV